MTEESIRLLIADDHPIVLAGLQYVLGSQPDFEVVGKAGTGAEAVALASRLNPDVVVMDLRMPEMDGVQATALIKAERPEIYVLVLTAYASDADILTAIETGATGYLLKDTPCKELFQAIRDAAQGKPVLTSSVAVRLMERMRGPAEEALSSREIEVLRLVAKGASNREVAEELYVSQATVKTHLIHIFGKLGVSDRTAAVTKALDRGILRLES